MTEPFADPFRSPTFMAPPGAVADWRLVLVYDAARTTGLLDALPATVADAAARCGLAPVAVRAVLDVLVAAGVLAVDDAPAVDDPATTPAAGTGGADPVVRPGPFMPDAATDTQLHQHATTMRRWANSLEPRLRGEDAPQRGVFQLKEWLQSMAVHAADQADEVAEVALDRLGPRPHRIRALDLGGGHGRYAAALAARGAHVVMQDRADVVATVVGEGWLAGTGVELLAGDFHEQLAAGPFDVVLAVGVMHTMAPDLAASLLARVAQRMRPGGVLVIRTMLRNAGPTSALFAVQMLVAGLGGDTHRLEDYRRWLADAGLTEPEVTPAGNGSMLVARKP